MIKPAANKKSVGPIWILYYQISEGSDVLNVKM